MFFLIKQISECDISNSFDARRHSRFFAPESVFERRPSLNIQTHVLNNEYKNKFRMSQETS